jgi:hypothetical protein
MPTQYYLPRNELTYRYRYTKNNIGFKHYVEKGSSFIVCCIAALIDLQPLSWECRTLLDFLTILVDGASGKGYSITTFFKEETSCGTLPEIVELVHYAHCLFIPSEFELVTLKTHIRLFEHCSLIQYLDFIKSRWNELRLQSLSLTSTLFKRIK